MPTTMTLNGVHTSRAKAAVQNFVHNARARFAGLGATDAAAGDPWNVSVNDRPLSPAGQFLASALGFGILSFAASTAAVRGWQAVERRMPRRLK